jgi:UDP-N-acetylmuramoyl-tripeptide--D-alanyl-D-alanine ligase
VADALAALQALGLENRRRFLGRVAAVTGSNGKTTTRRLIAAISRASWRTLEPQKNYNNHIGVPLTLLALGPEHDRAVLELGCSDFGEITLLSRLARPDVALVTNVGPAHLEKLGNLDGVARAKGELFAGLGPGATAVINLDDPRVAAMPIAGAEALTYGATPRADVRRLGRRPRGAAGQTVRAALLGREVDLELALAGRHNAANAVAAAAAGIALGCTIEDIVGGLASVAATPGRLFVCRGARGTVIVDDTYNANPSSMGAALEALEELAPEGRRIAVLADMLELGASSTAAHREIGRAAAAARLKLLVTFGEGGRCLGEAAVLAGLGEERWRHVDGHEEAGRAALAPADPGDAILIKGSHGMHMENVVRAVRGSEE